MKVRVIKTASKAVQVVRYRNNKRIVLQHIGSTHRKNLMTFMAEEWMKNYTLQLSMFTDENPNKLSTGSILILFRKKVVLCRTFNCKVTK